MSGADSHTENNLFSSLKLDDFVPASHPLRIIRNWFNEALAQMTEKFSAMYEADIKGGRPSIGPEKLMRAMLLQVLFNKNRDRLIEHEAVTELFNATANMVERRGLLSGEHFSVDGTLIKAWAGHKSMRRKNGPDEGSPLEDWRGEPRSNDTRESSSDGESRLYRESHAAPALPSYLGHVLGNNRHGLVINVRASQANGVAEREAAPPMLAKVAEPGRRRTVAADKAYDAKCFVKACREINVTSHVAKNTNRPGGSAIHG